jgi:hypothetical protein
MSMPLPPSHICGQCRYRASAADTRDAGFNYLSNVDIARRRSSFTVGDGRPAVATSDGVVPVFQRTTTTLISPQPPRRPPTATSPGGVAICADFCRGPPATGATVATLMPARGGGGGVDEDGDGDGDRGGKEKCGDSVRECMRTGEYHVVWYCCTTHRGFVSLLVFHRPLLHWGVIPPNTLSCLFSLPTSRRKSQSIAAPRFVMAGSSCRGCPRTTAAVAAVARVLGIPSGSDALRDWTAVSSLPSSAAAAAVR